MMLAAAILFAISGMSGATVGRLPIYMRSQMTHDLFYTTLISGIIASVLSIVTFILEFGVWQGLGFWFGLSLIIALFISKLTFVDGIISIAALVSFFIGLVLLICNWIFTP
ncbi:MAG: hypothetical protein ACK4NO_04245 [Glycocaulis sp.]